MILACYIQFVLPNLINKASMEIRTIALFLILLVSFAFAFDFNPCNGIQHKQVFLPLTQDSYPTFHTDNQSKLIKGQESSASP